MAKHTENSAVSNLLGELYRKMRNCEPMDPRRCKRLASIPHVGDTETINRLAGGWVNSQEMRAAARKAKLPLHRVSFRYTEGGKEIAVIRMR